MSSLAIVPLLMPQHGKGVRLTAIKKQFNDLIQIIFYSNPHNLPRIIARL